jgi:hypothetical protein
VVPFGQRPWFVHTIFGVQQRQGQIRAIITSSNTPAFLFMCLSFAIDHFGSERLRANGDQTPGRVRLVQNAEIDFVARSSRIVHTEIAILCDCRFETPSW